MSLIEHEIIGKEAVSHAFTSEDEGYTTMGAYIINDSGVEERVAWVDIEVLPQSTTPPTVVETMGSFPTGTSTDNLVLIYHEDKNYVKDLVVTDLNTYARNYLISIGEAEENDSQNITYFGEDAGTGEIYVTLKLPEGSPEYGNEYYNEKEKIIKVYVKGTAEIIGYEYGTATSQNKEVIQIKETTQDDYGIQLSPGYCCVIGNVIYMFISTKACLVNVSNNKENFHYRNQDKENVFSNFNEPLKDDGYYLYMGQVCIQKNTIIKAPKDIIINKGNFEETVPVIFDTTEIKYFVTAETMTEIEYFANITNAANVTLLGIKKIGDYSFSGSNISGDILSQAGNLEEIGKYAFAKTPNLSLNSNNESLTTIFPLNLKRIGECAFANSDGIKGIDLTSCSYLEYVGKQAFASCVNLHDVFFLEKQIAHDEATTDLLYLPPDKGDGDIYVPRTRNSIFNTTDFENNRKVVTVRYDYNYKSNQSQEYTISEYEQTQGTIKKTFDQDSNIAWGCTI